MFSLLDHICPTSRSCCLVQGKWHNSCLLYFKAKTYLKKKVSQSNKCIAIMHWLYPLFFCFTSFNVSVYIYSLMNHRLRGLRFFSWYMLVLQSGGSYLHCGHNTILHYPAVRPKYIDFFQLTEVSKLTSLHSQYIALFFDNIAFILFRLPKIIIMTYNDFSVHLSLPIFIHY